MFSIGSSGSCQLLNHCITSALNSSNFSAEDYYFQSVRRNRRNAVAFHGFAAPDGGKKTGNGVATVWCRSNMKEHYIFYWNRNGLARKLTKKKTA